MFYDCLSAESVPMESIKSVGMWQDIDKGPVSPLFSSRCKMEFVQQ